MEDIRLIKDIEKIDERYYATLNELKEAYERQIDQLDIQRMKEVEAVIKRSIRDGTLIQDIKNSELE